MVFLSLFCFCFLSGQFRKKPEFGGKNRRSQTSALENIECVQVDLAPAEGLNDNSKSKSLKGKDRGRCAVRNSLQNPNEISTCV